MGSRTTIFEKGGLYHLFNRSVTTSPLFQDPPDYFRFMALLQNYSEETGIAPLVWCLMPNHYHILALQLSENNHAGQLPQYISNAYVKYYNRKYVRAGHLFSRAYGARPVSTATYLYRVACYIHLNPVKAGLVERPGDWLFSNYLDFIAGKTAPYASLQIPGMPSPERYRDFVEHRTQRRSLFTTTKG